MSPKLTGRTLADLPILARERVLIVGDKIVDDKLLTYPWTKMMYTGSVYWQ